MQINGTYNDIAASPIFDSAKDIGAFPPRMLQPGKKLTSKIVFSIPHDEAGEIQVEVTPSFQQDTAVFTGNG